MFNFEKLDVWQKAIDFADLVYNYTRHFPPDERFGLTNQMRRAAVSISSNIAEGNGRSRDKMKGPASQIQKVSCKMGWDVLCGVVRSLRTRRELGPQHNCRD
jgi:23S rRNA-intervening sequence protein